MPFTSFASGGSVANPDYDYEYVGFQADGGGTVVTANSSAHTKGAYAQLGTTSQAWSSFEVFVANNSNSTSRIIFDVSIDGGTSILCPNVFAWTGGTTNGNCLRYMMPMSVGSGADIRIRMQALTGSATANFFVVGTVSEATHAPGFTAMTALNVDTANTRATTTTVAFDDTWVSQIDPTAAAYGALLAVMDSGTAAGTSNQAGTLTIGAGPSGGGSETTLYRLPFNITTTGITLRAGPQVIRSAVASGVRLSAKADAPANPTDTARVGLYGFS